MISIFKKIIFNFTFNSVLFLFLMIGIQNSSESTKVNLITNETMRLPISFIIGLSFISGSLTGSFLTTNMKNTDRNL